MKLSKFVKKVYKKLGVKCIDYEGFLDEFLMEFSSLYQMVHETSSGISLNEQVRVYNLRGADTLQAGEEGYMGRYKLPCGMSGLMPTRVEAFNGCCHTKIELNTLNKMHGDTQFYSPLNKCLKCKGDFPTEFRIVNGHIVLDPIPKKVVEKGLVVWYERVPFMKEKNGKCINEIEDLVDRDIPEKQLIEYIDKIDIPLNPSFVNTLIYEMVIALAPELKKGATSAEWNKWLTKREEKREMMNREYGCSLVGSKVKPKSKAFL